MAHVVLTGSLRRYTGGEAEFDLAAGNIHQLMKALAARHPDLEPHLEEGLAVAIDGTIYQDDWFVAIPPDSEVHLIPKIGGG